MNAFKARIHGFGKKLVGAGRATAGGSIMPVSAVEEKPISKPSDVGEAVKHNARARGGEARCVHSHIYVTSFLSR